jgi:hypothetical protein
MVIHAALLVACHEQPLAVVTATVAVVASAEAHAPNGDIVVEHGMPSCVTVTVCPAIVIDPVRAALLVLASIAIATVPLPLPGPAFVMSIHGVEDVAVQLHPVAAVTVIALLVAGD